MIQKIQILKLAKPEEYIRRDLLVLKSSKNKLLTSSDWTQVLDCGLTVKNILQWRFWRNNVRDLNVDNHNLLLETGEKLKALEEIKPSTVKRTSEQFVYPLSDFNYSSLESFRNSCILIIQERFKAAKKKERVAVLASTTIEDAFDNMIKVF